MANNNEFQLKVLEWCRCVLDEEKGDPPYLNLSEKEKDFIDKNLDVLQLEILKTEEIRDIKKAVDEFCLSYLKESLDVDITPYKTLYGKELIDEYKELILGHCGDKCSKELIFIEYVIDRLIFKSQELQNISDYIFKQTRKTFDSRTTVLETRVSGLNSYAQKVETQISEIDKKSKKTDNKLKNSEKKMIETTITILGIFSAIVLTFNAGVTFSSEVMTTLIHSSFYRAIIIVSIFGIILGNVIFALLFYLEHLRKEKEGTSKITTFFKWPFLIVNVVLILIILVVSVLWWIGVDLRREENVKNISTTSVTENQPNDDGTLNNG